MGSSEKKLIWLHKFLSITWPNKGDESTRKKQTVEHAKVYMKYMYLYIRYTEMQKKSHSLYIMDLVQMLYCD